MPQQQLNALIALSHCLPVIAEQLRIMNELKAIELKRGMDPSVKAPYEWCKAVDKAMKRD